MLGLKQYGVPTRMADECSIDFLVLNSIRDFDWSRPRLVHFPRDPNAHIGVLFLCATEPSGYECSIRCLNDGRCVATWKGCFFIEEFRLKNRRLLPPCDACLNQNDQPITGFQTAIPSGVPSMCCQFL